MAYNFPDSPGLGQIFTPPGGPTWTWSNGAWVQTVAVESALIGAQYFESIAQASASSIDPSLEVVHLTGYYNAGDGGDALYRKVVSAPTHQAKFQSADGAWWEIVLPSGEIRIEQLGGRAEYISIANPGFDNYAAIMAATEIPMKAEVVSSAFTWGPVIKFRIGRYYCSQKINLKRMVTFKGAGSGRIHAEDATDIYWPADTTFIETNSIDTFDGAIVPVTTSAAYSKFEGIAFHGQAASTDRTRPGFRMRSTATIRECVFDNTPGTAIEIRCQALGGAATRGNSNGWYIERTMVAKTGLHGLHVQHSDSNAGTAVAFQALHQIYGHGIWDQDTFGNAYIGCQIDAWGNHYKQLVSYGGWAYILVGSAISGQLEWTSGTNYARDVFLMASNRRFYYCTIDGGTSTVEPDHTTGAAELLADGFEWVDLGVNPPTVRFATNTVWASVNYLLGATVRAPNGRFYTCVVDPGGAILSTIPPTHTSGIAAPGDGYSWQHHGIRPPTTAQTTIPGTNENVWYSRYVADAVDSWDPEREDYEMGLPVYCSGASNRSVFCETYTESGPSHIGASLAVSMGGQSGFTRNSSHLVSIIGSGLGSSSGVGSNAALPLAHDLSGGTTLNNYFITRIGANPDLNAVLEFFYGANGGYINILRILSNDLVMMIDGGLGTVQWGTTLKGTAQTFGRATTPVEGVFFARRFGLGDGSTTIANRRIIQYGAIAPTTGEHAAGEIVFDISPTAGGFVGWVCTTAGTPGTWKTFGVITA